MERPTLSGLWVRSTKDARLIFHAVAQEKLPLIVRRLTNDERRAYIRTGSVFVWEERGSTSKSTGGSMERWTDGKRWSPSRVRDEFLIYHEQVRDPHKRSGQAPLTKQTFSVYVNTQSETRKWHLVAYSTPSSVDRLKTIDAMLDMEWVPDLEEVYRSARNTKGRRRGEDLLYEVQPPNQRHDGAHLYPPYGCGYPSPHHHLSPTHSLPKIRDEYFGRPFTHIRRAGDHRGADASRSLVPLIYLKKLRAPPRPAWDDSAIRALDSSRL